MVGGVEVAAGDEQPGADRHRDHRADRAVDVAAVLHRLRADPGVDVLRVVVRVVRVDPVVVPPRVVLGQAGVAREQRVGGDARRVVEEPVVVGPDRVPGGAGVAERVVVAAVVPDLDGVAGGLEVRVVGVQVRARARVDAGVPVEVGLGALDQAVVAGEGEDAVLVVAAGEHVVEHEAVGLEHVDRVELGLLEGDVAQVEPAGAVRADAVELPEPVVHRDVGDPSSRPDDLGAAEPAVARDVLVPRGPVTEDRDQVQVVRAGALVGVGQRDRVRGAVRALLRAGVRRGEAADVLRGGQGSLRRGLEVRAVRRAPVPGPAPLLVGPREHVDRRAPLRDRVDRGLDRVEPALPEQPLVRPLQRPVGHARDARGTAGPAHHPVSRVVVAQEPGAVPGAVGELGGPFLVRGGGGAHPGHEGGGGQAGGDHEGEEETGESGHRDPFVGLPTTSL